MNRIQTRDAVFWVLWSFGLVATTLAVIGEGTPQEVGEWYLIIMSVANSIFVVALVLSSRFQQSLLMTAERRRVPHSLEWAGIIVMFLAGLAIDNWVICFGAVVGAITKPRADAIHEQLRRQSLPLRALRDGAVHPEELR